MKIKLNIVPKRSSIWPGTQETFKNCQGARTALSLTQAHTHRFGFDGQADDYYWWKTTPPRHCKHQRILNQSEPLEGGAVTSINTSAHP